MSIRTAVHGLYGGSSGYYLAGLLQGKPRLVVITPNQKTAEEVRADIEFFLEGTTAEEKATILSFPAWDTLALEPLSPDTALTGERISTLAQTQELESWIIITPAEALLQRVQSHDLTASLQFELRSGTSCPKAALIKKLDQGGFKQVSVVEHVGDIAVRGSVVDIYPAHTDSPIRIEMQDERITSLRHFQISDQRSTSEIQQVTIYPIREFLGPASAAEVEQVRERCKELQLPHREQIRIVDAIQSETEMPGRELICAQGRNLTAFFDAVPADATYVFIDEAATESTLDELDEEREERTSRFSKEHLFFPTPEKVMLTAEELLEALTTRKHIVFDSAALTTEDTAHNLRALPLTELLTALTTKVGTGHALAPLRTMVEGWRRDGYGVVFSVGSEQRGERLRRMLRELGFEAGSKGDQSLYEWSQRQNGDRLIITLGALSKGFILTRAKIVCIAEHEIFRERWTSTSKRQTVSLKRIMSSLAKLSIDDHVVHADYGIGIYRGLHHQTVDGFETDFLVVEYADSKLYLPVHQITKIRKFHAAEGAAPEMDKLGSNRWIRTKDRVKRSVATLAGDLIKLYASREIVQGWRFEPWGAEDERFADGFPYQATPDQAKAIHETVKDLSAPKPMDRLVCGDVGFGKTEVALRAAFKAIQHGRQVAVLAPTTILVDQHRDTFAKRFIGYPVKVSAISRFYDRAENKKTLEEMAKGEVDIIVGTHKLLSKDVTFKDLGLLIIDEEHRFGVQQKEKIKALKKQVDVLTLTATPIPRTLHMALLGIRDVSVITSPPVDRRVVRTHVIEQHEGLIRDAIIRELHRGGQCFYLRNRIQGIELVTEELRKLVPEARIEFAHGQMNEELLEDMMHRFIKHEFDVLISTTIIESGIDIPNANTLLVERADMFGLAQLYQIRGRVGRSDKQAYAYLMVPNIKKVTPDARRRLAALQALDELGVGFQLALTDLEIRGAGNLLGKEQSGNVADIGFDLYTKILKEAVTSLKGQKLALEDTIDPEVKFVLDAYIPEFHIPDVTERLVMYQRFSAAGNPAEVDELESEIIDRFGPMPPQAKDFVDLMRLRSVLKGAGIIKAEELRERLVLSFSPQAPIDPERLEAYLKSHKETSRISNNTTLSLDVSLDVLRQPGQLTMFVQNLIKRLKRAELVADTPEFSRSSAST